MRLMGMASVITLLAMMLLTTTDVVARYVFNSPIRGAFELTEILLATLVFLAMPLTTQLDEHVRVDLIKLPPKSRREYALRLFGVLVLAGVFAVLAWQIWEHAGKLEKYGTVSNSLSIPISIVAFLVAICCGISAIAAALSLKGTK